MRAAAQRATYNLISIGHSIVTGAHAAHPLSDFSGWERRTAQPDGEATVPVDGIVALCIESPGTLLESVYAAKPNIGNQVDGVFEAVIGFGGEQTWSALVLLKRVK